MANGFSQGVVKTVVLIMLYNFIGAVPADCHQFHLRGINA